MIICEIGQNFCGDMILAKHLIREAKLNGGDLCKFQLYSHEKLYKDTNIPNCELSFEQAKELFDFGKGIGMEVFFSVFDIERVKWCEWMGVKRYKIASGSIDDKELHDTLYKTRKPVIQSLGGGVLRWKASEEMYYLYCIPKYPANLYDINFKNARFVKVEHWTYSDGFSDHTIGLDASKIALARGAQIIEKHFCLDHHTGIDAEWSMTPEELRELKRFEGVVGECR